jgi:hypothetical protein
VSSFESIVDHIHEISPFPNPALMRKLLLLALAVVPGGHPTRP